MQETLIISIKFFFGALYIVMFVTIILSWFPQARRNRFVSLLYAFVDPILMPIRRILQRSPLGGPGMVLDFSPIIAFFLIRLAEELLVGLVLQTM